MHSGRLHTERSLEIGADEERRYNRTLNCNNIHDYRPDYHQ